MGSATFGLGFVTKQWTNPDIDTFMVWPRAALRSLCRQPSSRLQAKWFVCHRSRGARLDTVPSQLGGSRSCRH